MRRDREQGRHVRSERQGKRRGELQGHDQVELPCAIPHISFLGDVPWKDRNEMIRASESVLKMRKLEWGRGGDAGGTIHRKGKRDSREWGLSLPCPKV